MIAILIFSLVAYAIIATLLLRARHAGRGQMYLWIPLTAAFGLIGILLLLSMLDKPRSLRCKSCGKRRLVTEDRCPNCDACADSPAMEGIEIFEPASHAVMA